MRARNWAIITALGRVAYRLNLVGKYGHGKLVRVIKRARIVMGTSLDIPQPACYVAPLTMAFTNWPRGLSASIYSIAMASRKLNIFIIGSSATILMDPYLRRMLSEDFSYSRKGDESSEMQEALADLDCPAGASAGDSSMVLAYLRTLEATIISDWDVVLMHVGLHDIKRDLQSSEPQVPIHTFRENVKRIVEWFTANNIGLVWMRPGPLDEKLHNTRCADFRRFEADLHEYNRTAESIVAKRNIPIIDLARFTERLGSMDQLLKDHVHFQDDVVRQQAAYLAGFLAGHFD